MPEKWEDLEAAIELQIEGVDLEFKRELPDKASAVWDIAKDAAALSIEGGVIVIGVDEEEGVVRDHSG